MKNIVRVSALALIAAGVVSANVSRTPKAPTKVVAMNSALPVPSCPPNDPNACGMGALEGR